MATPDFQRYFNRLSQRLPKYERESAEWLFQTGTILREARMSMGFTRATVAERMGIDINDLRLVEQGLGEREQLTEEWISRFSEAIEMPDLVDRIRRES